MGPLDPGGSPMRSLVHAVRARLRASTLPLLAAAALAACGGKAAPGGPGGPDAGPDTSTPCAALQLEAGATVDQVLSDVYTWQDARCRPRSAALVRAGPTDRFGTRGGYVRRLTYEVDGATRTCTSTNGTWPGWGFVVSHYGDGTPAVTSRGVAATGRTLFQGRHHALHELRWALSIQGQPLDVVVHYLFATGRDHPLYAITHDASRAPADAYAADTRSPYGDLAFGGSADEVVAGVGWGDQYKFVSLDAPLTMQSRWDYSQPNRVPYTWMWTQTPDAEMGVVQTQTWQQHDAGGYWLYARWGQRSGTGEGMPEAWNWTYQLNQYELPSTQTSHRMAWGSNFGAVGRRAYPAYGDARTLPGYPHQSYSVFLVLGKRTDGVVARQVAEVEAVQDAGLTATAGSVATQGPGGVGRTDAVAFPRPGFNPVYATWEAEAAGGRADLRFAVAGGRTLEHPVLVLRGWTSAQPPARVTVDGQELAADAGYFASVDDAGDRLWLTLRASVRDGTAVRVE